MRLALCLALVLGLASCGAEEETAEPGRIDDSDQAPPAEPDGPLNSLPDQGAEPLESNASVDRVVDGDTIVVEVQGRSERVRLIGIDTPESVAQNRPVQCYGVESSEYLTALLPPGTPVTLIRDVEARDRYDRLLAYVVRSDDGLFINLDLVANGYAGPLTYPPNDYSAELFVGAASEAAIDGIGLWSACGGPDVPIG